MMLQSQNAFALPSFVQLRSRCQLYELAFSFAISEATMRRKGSILAACSDLALVYNVHSSSDSHMRYAGGVVVQYHVHTLHYNRPIHVWLKNKKECIYLWFIVVVSTYQ